MGWVGCAMVFCVVVGVDGVLGERGRGDLKCGDVRGWRGMAGW